MSYMTEFKKIGNPKYARSWVAVILTAVLLIQFSLIMDDLWQTIGLPIKGAMIFITFFLVVTLGWKRNVK